MSEQFGEKEHLNSLGDNCMYNKFDLFAGILMTFSHTGFEELGFGGSGTRR